MFILVNMYKKCPVQNLEVQYGYQCAVKSSVCGLLAFAFHAEVHCRFWMVDMFYTLPKKEKKKDKKVHIFLFSYITRLKHTALSKNIIVPILAVCIGRGFFLIGMMFTQSCLKM